jgi:hypothetical protein
LADDLIAKYGIKGALKAADKNLAKSVSVEQANLWDQVAEKIVYQCTHPCHDDPRHSLYECCPTCGEEL